jgi:hypothetical protein
LPELQSIHAHAVTQHSRNASRISE